MLNVGVVGYGYWGPKVARNLSTISDSTVVCVCDSEPKRLQEAQRHHAGVKTTTDFRDLTDDPKVDAIAVATPVTTHFDLAMAAMKAGKHVLVEKPLARSSQQAERMIEEATKRHVVLMVDHVFIFTGAVRTIKKLIDSGRLGELFYYDSVRINLGLFQKDINVIWDLAVHDLSIMDHVLFRRPEAVSATGIANISGQQVNAAYLTCFFPSNLIGHIHVNWLAPAKVRRTIIGGDNQMIIYNDLEPSEKVKVYNRGLDVSETFDSKEDLMVNYRTGDMWAPQIDQTEGLSVVVRHFRDCIFEDKQPIANGQAGLRIVQIMEAADKSLEMQGSPVEIRW